ncbi:MAG: nucleoside deaminase [Candidatus Micrarchaeaceae archaeon]|jgi:tRNA(Arg) A34 adenosine deaminase TadA
MHKAERKFMEIAIKEAIKTRKKGDYAIGAVIVKSGKVIVKVGNRTKLDSDPTQHAEIVAIKKASKILKTRHLEGCVLYSTHEPCPMCTAATIWAKMDGIVFGSNISDMHNYRIKNANDKWLWRTINISAKKIIEKSDTKPFVVENFMRKKCRNLFHS